MSRAFISFAVSTLALVISMPVCAQDSVTQAEGAAETSGLSDIIVTAQRRNEDLQSTALAIEAASAATLARAGISNADQLTNQFSGVQIGGGTTPQIYIRGVGDFGVLPSANPAVVTSLDGVAISRPQAIGGNFFDLERVELLKGPQGTLYGRNASGGALNLVSARPRLGKTSGFVQFDAGNYEFLSGEGAVNLPLGESTALRVAAQVTSRDGYLTDGSGDDVHQSLRIQTYSEIGDKVDLRLQATYNHSGGVGTGIALISPLGQLDPWTGTASREGGQVLLDLAQANFVASGGTSPPPFLIGRPDASLLTQDVETWSASAELNIDLDAAVLTVVPAYRAVDYTFVNYPSFLFGPGFGKSNGEQADQMSLEVRLAGESGPVKWIVGGYAFDESQDTGYVVNSGLIQNVRFGSDLETRAFAGFADLTLEISDSLRFSGGIRYTSDRRAQLNIERFAISPTVIDTDLTDGINGDDPCLPPRAAPGGECDLNLGIPSAALDTRDTFNEVTWKLGFEADLGADSLLFAHVTTGFKAGGFNLAIDPATLTSTLPFNTEKITAYTLGLKNEFLGGDLRLNVEAYFWDYKDLQLTQLLLDGVGQVALTTVNAGKAETMGIRVDTTARLWKGGILQAGVEYNKSEYKEFLVVQPAALVAPGSTGCRVTPSTLPPGPAGPLVTTDCSGFELVRAPKWSGTFGFSQEFELQNRGFIRADVNGSFASARFLNTAFTADTRSRGYLTVSTSVEYTPQNENWFVRGWVRNLTNEVVYTGGGGGVSPFVVGYVSGSLNPPRTYGLTLGYRFD